VPRCFNCSKSKKAQAFRKCAELTTYAQVALMEKIDKLFDKIEEDKQDE
jgi:hypothetical protein